MLALLLLSVVVMLHEFGHFLAAKATGVRVNEFSIGMGPLLLHWGKGETRWSLRALPIGGYCAMEGEDGDFPTPAALGGSENVEPADSARSFANKKVWQRMLIVVAGVLMNFLLGYVLLVGYYGLLQEPNSQGQYLFGTTMIGGVDEQSSEYQTGLRSGDTILSVNGRRVFMITDMSLEMQSDRDGVLSMVVSRPTENGAEKVTLDNVKFEVRVDEETGQQYLNYNFFFYGIERTFGNTFVQAAKDEVSVATVVWRTLADMVRGRYGLNDLSGPVGTVGMIADTVGKANSLDGLRTLVYLMILITVNLGVFNLLPLPALDGGRLIFLIWEAVTRKPVPQKYEAIVHLVGIVLLLLLMLVVTYSDIRKFFV